LARQGACPGASLLLRASGFQAVLLAAFGGPESPEEVMPFLERVVVGRKILPSRLEEVATHYHHCGGRSPVNDHNRALARALEVELAGVGLDWPVYLGNRNWHPYFEETLVRMREDGIGRALALFTTPYGSYPGCRQYLEDLERARATVGEGAPELVRVRSYFDHPGFIQASIERTRQALESLPEVERPGARLVFTAHNLPLAMARTSPYVGQLRLACSLVAEALGRPDWNLVFQSRSGPSGQPWLEPDLLDFLQGLPGTEAVLLSPIGFLSDHVEVLWDLDVEAAELCRGRGLSFRRAATVGVHSSFVRGLRQLLEESARPGSPVLKLQPEAFEHRTCGAECCRMPSRAY